jgi:hypothetical protein
MLKEIPALAPVGEMPTREPACATCRTAAVRTSVRPTEILAEFGNMTGF